MTVARLPGSTFICSRGIVSLNRLWHRLDMETIPKPEINQGPQNLATPSRILLGGEPRCDNCDTPYTNRCEMLFENDPELCDKCLATERIFRVTVGEGEDKNVVFCAGLSHLEQRINEELYWPYCEFSPQEFEDMNQELNTMAEAALRALTANQVDEPVQTIVDRYTHYLQAIWTDGVSRGVFDIDGKWRVWPIRFQIKVEELTREEGQALAH